MSQKPFPHPRVLADVTDKSSNNRMECTISSGTSSTEEIEVDNQEWELLVREETQMWLATHGPKLFALEASKFNAQEAKKKNLRGNR